MQRAGLDQQEIGDQRAHLGDMLDPADEIAVGGVELLDDRRAAVGAIAVRDHHVDHVAAEAGIARRVHGLLDDGVVLLAGGQKEPDVADQIPPGRLEEIDGLQSRRERRRSDRQAPRARHAWLPPR